MASFPAPLAEAVLHSSQPWATPAVWALVLALVALGVHLRPPRERGQQSLGVLCYIAAAELILALFIPACWFYWAAVPVGCIMAAYAVRLTRKEPSDTAVAFSEQAQTVSLAEGSPVPSHHAAPANHDAPPALPDKPVRMELTDEAREVVAADLAEPRHPPTDTAGLARTLRAHYGCGRPIRTDAENAPNRAEVYKANQRFVEWGTSIESTLTSQLFGRMAAFVLALERPDPPLRNQLFQWAALLGEGGLGGHDRLLAHVEERLERLQALIEALEGIAQ
jgi:hypothetical protein